MFFSQFFINVLMTVGLFPITGIPLPLLSYGGSSLLANFIAVSLVLNVKMRRFVNF
jgi:rod shape determining protein RodA